MVSLFAWSSILGFPEGFESYVLLDNGGQASCLRLAHDRELPRPIDHRRGELECLLHGDAAFQQFWQTTWAGRNGHPLSQVMGDCADGWQATHTRVSRDI